MSIEIFFKNVVYTKNTVMMEVTKYIYFWLNYFDKDNHVERILVAADYIVYLFCIGSESPESDELNLVLISDGT